MSHQATDGLFMLVREFQRFNGLQETGRLDPATVQKMQSPRCGLPDLVRPSERAAQLRSDPETPLAFYAPGWNDGLSYDENIWQ